MAEFFPEKLVVSCTTSTREGSWPFSSPCPLMSGPQQCMFTPNVPKLFRLFSMDSQALHGSPLGFPIPLVWEPFTTSTRIIFLVVSFYTVPGLEIKNHPHV